MSCPVLTVAEMRQWEAATWASGQSEQTVIARVGELVARRCLALTRSGDTILLLAGIGHNGDDVRMAERHLSDRRIERLDVAEPAAQSATLSAALFRKPALIVDGLFGIGLNRPLAADWRSFIEEVNGSRIPILAVDAPSGLNCDTGEPEGAAIRADLTLTLGAPKEGLLRPGAWQYVGRLEVESEIGLVKCPVTSQVLWTLPGDFTKFPPRRFAASHKGSYGHVWIVAGSLGFHGAAVLSARGAAAAMPGLITLVTSPDVYTPIASQLRSVMVRPWNEQLEMPEKATAILVGPGLAASSVPEGVRNRFLDLWHSAPVPMVADASALDWLRDARSSLRKDRFITPHPGEAARLLDTEVATVQSNRAGAVRQLSSRLGGAFVVLKGHQTMMGREGGPLYLNGSGGPRLAQGGSGDVLAGYLAGMLAQPQLASEGELAARFAVWRHGLAGESPDWNGLIDELPRALTAI